MAVVSISRIQIRRGKKFSDTGIPQLASGEFGWAVDAQELYIGNGSVAEGAPYVGNTQLLTEHTNLFEYVKTYTYRSDDSYIQTGSSENSPVQRSLQDRLDDIVSVRAFGALGDGTTQTAALQRAIFQLFLNDANKTTPNSRVVLHMEPGTYTVDSTIYIPPYVTIVGAGSDKTVINSTVDGPVFRTINSASTPDTIADDSLTTTQNQPKNINISGMTVNVKNQYGGLLLRNCVDSVFRDIKIRGNWETSSGVWDESYAVRLESLSSIVTNKNNTFIDCDFGGTYRLIASDHDISNNKWIRCYFSQSEYGIVFGENTVIGNPAQSTGPTNNIISQCTFDNIDLHGVWIKNGKYNISKNNKYHSVGYDGGSPANVGNVVSVIHYDDSSNSSTDDWFERTSLYSRSLAYITTVPYVPEISGTVAYVNRAPVEINLTQSSTPARLFRLPIEQEKNIKIKYFYASDTVDLVKSGELQITVDPSAQNAIISDDYNFTGDSQYQKSIAFSIELLDFDIDGIRETLTILYTNSITDDVGKFNYTVEYIN